MEETCLGWALSLGRSEHELAKQLIAALKSLAAYINIGASGPSNIRKSKVSIRQAAVYQCA